MDITNRIQTFIELGKSLASFPEPLSNGAVHPLIEASVNAYAANPWFTPENIRYAINALGEAMTGEKLIEWVQPYGVSVTENKPAPKTIGVVTAGNIPLAGFHDFLCILISGNRFCGKLSGQDNILLPAIAGLLESMQPQWKERICFIDKPFEQVDAIIATGSDNTFRYFEYYFSRYPHILRKNRNGIAVLHGNETELEMIALASDIMLYFGLGCRSISKLYVPSGYDLMKLLPSFEPWQHLIRHNKYYNNYEYQKSIRIVNKQNFYDFGNLLLNEESGLSSPVSVVNFERYNSLADLSALLVSQGHNIQCIVSASDPGTEFVLPGMAQKPGLGDYADSIDTLSFLLNEI